MCEGVPQNRLAFLELGQPLLKLLLFLIGLLEPRPDFVKNAVDLFQTIIHGAQGFFRLSDGLIQRCF